MIGKKAQGISMTYVIIAALGLIVLIVIALFFTGSLKTLTKEQAGVVGGTVGENQKNLWRSQCESFCQLGQSSSFCNSKFSVPNSEETETCSTLGVVCSNKEVDCGP